MKSKLVKGILGLVLIGLLPQANATLFDRGNGMIYDSDQDLTWLQDANYAATSGYDADGRMSWDNAMTWATSLSFGGFSDWRLPTITDTGTSGCNWSFDGTDCGYNVDTSASEMAYMWYDILGNTPYYDTSGNGPQTGWGLTSTSADGVSFSNLQSYVYWSGTEYAPNTNYAWFFNTGYGYQSLDDKGSEYYAWAVRSGDVGAVPEPSILLLLGTGLAGLGFARRAAKRRL